MGTWISILCVVLGLAGFIAYNGFFYYSEKQQKDLEKKGK
jgi:uncharacterized protein YneF (UPF0154 family)